jgi:adenylate cyclase
LEHILSGQHLARPDYAPGLEAFALAIGGVIVGLVARRLSPLLAALISLALLVGAALASFFMFYHFDLLFDPLVPGATWLATYGVTTVALYRRTDRERRFVRSAFSRYLAPAIVERLAADPSHLRLGGELRTVTILFSDARDFTQRSEGRSAAGVVHFLNRLLTPCTAAVLAESGTVDKYIGDALMAFWNAPLDVPDHANRACRAALAMLAVLPEVDAAEREDAAAEGRPHIPVRIGVGLNTGDVFVGNMGSEQRFDYSIVGDPVNVASRLETATKEYGVPIIASEETVALATDFRFVDLGAIPLKGKSAATQIFALDGPRDPATEADFEAFHELHVAALTAARAGAPDADAAIERVKAHRFGGRYAAFYARLMKEHATPRAALLEQEAGGS